MQYFKITALNHIYYYIASLPMVHFFNKTNNNELFGLSLVSFIFRYIFKMYQPQKYLKTDIN